MQPHLGDCIGEPVILTPIWPRRIKSPYWFAPLVHRLLGWVAVAVYALLILAWGIMVFMPLARAEPVKYRVPTECRDLLARYGKNYGIPPDAWMLTHDQAFKAWVALENKSWWPGVNICLKAVNKTWRF